MGGKGGGAVASRGISGLHFKSPGFSAPSPVYLCLFIQLLFVSHAYSASLPNSSPVPSPVLCNKYYVSELAEMELLFFSPPALFFFLILFQCHAHCIKL